METALYLTLLAAHWAGDFPLQPALMAIRKGQDWQVRFEHVVRYTLTVALAAAPWALALRTPGPDYLWFTLATAALHYATDTVTSRLTRRAWFYDDLGPYHDGRPITRAQDGLESEARVYRYNGRYCRFFSTVGADQLAHHVALLGAAWWWLL